MVLNEKIFKIWVSRCSKNCTPWPYSQISLWNIFQITYYETFFFVCDFCKICISKWKKCMAINFWELRSDLSWKDAAINTERLYTSFTDGSRFVKKSERKRIFAWSIMHLNKWKHFRKQFLLLLWLLFASLFFSSVCVFVI